MSRVRLTRRATEAFLLKHHRECYFCRYPIADTDVWERHHVIELAAGGKDEPDNWRPAHAKCHRTYTAEVSAKRIAKTRHQKQKNSGCRPRPRQVMPGSRASKWKRTLDGRTILR